LDEEISNNEAITQASPSAAFWAQDSRSLTFPLHRRIKAARVTSLKLSLVNDIDAKKG